MVSVNLFPAKNHLSPDWYATSLNPWHEEAQPGTVINIDSLILQFPGPGHHYVDFGQELLGHSVRFILLIVSVSSKKIDGSLDEIILVIYLTERNYLRIMPIWNSI